MRSPIRPNTERSSWGAVRSNLVVLAGVAVFLVMNGLAVQPAARQPQPDDALQVDESGNMKVSGNVDASGTVRGKNLVSDEKATTKDLDVNGAATFSGIKVNAQATIAKSLFWSNGSELRDDPFQGGTIELGQSSAPGGPKGSPYIDFHFKGLQQDYNTRIINNENGKLSIMASTLYSSGSATVQQDLVVNGKTTINGELPPYTFEVGDKTLGIWHARQVDGSIIRDYLGDEDGGTIKILLRANDTDRVHVITETIYIEQPGKSLNKNPGLYGSTRQLGGGDTDFVLNTGTKNEIIPVPWGWVRLRNFPTGGQTGLPPRDGEAWRSGGLPWNEYRMEFVTNGNISATIIIYDR